MSQHSGYYSLVQFCPDPSRLESVNIGVVLYSATEKRLRVQISKSNQRIRRCFGNQDWNLLNRARKAVARQLRSQQFLTVDDFISYIAKRANMIQLTHPRPMRITDLDADTTELHKRLVGQEAPEPKRRIDGYLTKRLSEAGVSNLVKKSVSVELPEFRKPIRVPYAYQNGRFNLISPVQFDGDTDSIFAKIGKSAIEGELLFSKPHPTFGEMRLVVVGSFDHQIEASTREYVQRTFEQHRVTLYSFENLSPLVEDIKRSAEIHLIADKN
jgi:hypothetical protein